MVMLTEIDNQFTRIPFLWERSQQDLQPSQESIY